MGTPRDLSSFEEFYRRHRSWSRTLIKQTLEGTCIDWEDQWNNVWSEFSKYYLDPHFTFTVSQQAYLRRCLLNRARDALRGYVSNGTPVLLGMQDDLLTDIAGPTHDHLSNLLDGPNPPADKSGRGQDPVLAAAVSRLSPMQRGVVLFWSWKEPPPTDKEIGDEFGISASTAKTHRRRALNNLRRTLRAASVDTPEMGEELT
jgi:DNA-directed RNA polymerase specialized sigma24 family protein